MVGGLQTSFEVSELLLIVLGILQLLAVNSETKSAADMTDL